MENELYKKPLIFVVDDDEDDVFFITCALVNIIPECEVKCFRHGKQLMEDLAGRHNNFPSFILMDLNMPVLNGRDTLKRIRQNESMQEIPVIILTTSNNPLEKELCEKNGASYYFCKPSAMNIYDEMISMLKRQYIDKVALAS